MTYRYEVITFFDCTKTGVQNHRQSVNLSHEDWQYKRNQQRNFETIIQCISLRCQPMNINGPYVFSNNDGQLYWNFKFETEKQDIFLKDNNPVGILELDCDRVPMIVGLGENNKELFFTPYIITIGTSQNTFFRIVK